MSHSSELQRIALLAARFGQPARGVGIGDDAAVLEPVGSERLVWTIDAQVEGTHFRRDWASWEDVGWRSFMAAASDLAAMGASPLGALSALTLSDDVDDEALFALAEGQASAARAIGTTVVGGNLARGKETSVTTTFLGRVDRPILRRGAQPGDGVFIAGALGMAAAGLAALERSLAAVAVVVPGEADPSIAACVDAWRRPRALIELGQVMCGTATAAVDISDGLARDARHLAEASGVRLVFDEAALRAHVSSALRSAAATLGRDAIDLVLHGGEDYALLATSASPPPGFVRVGSVEAGEAVVLLAKGEGRVEVPPLGFDHFERRSSSK